MKLIRSRLLMGVALGAVMALVLAACGGDDPTPTPRPTATPTTAMMEPDPTATPVPTPTPTLRPGQPTPTPAPPTPTPTPAPEATPTPTLTENEAILQEGNKFLTYDQDWNPDPNAITPLVQAAAAEGTVHLTAYGTDHVDAICEAFEARLSGFGVNIECEGRGIGAGQIVGTLNAEREAGEAPTDVVYMSMTQMAQYIDDGYAEAVDWGALGADERRAWDAAAGVSGNALGVANNQYTNFYRTDIFSVEDLPKSVFEWTDEKYKDLACAPSFLFRAGNGFMAFRFDPDEMVRVQKEMIDDNGLLVTGDCNSFILSGERPLVWMGYGNPPALLDSGVIGQFWNDGQGINMFNVAVASNANNPNAAKLLAAWHSSKEASQALWDATGAGWAAYGHAAAGLTSGGDFEGVQMVFESVPVARQRGINANYFGEQVFGAQ